MTTSLSLSSYRIWGETLGFEVVDLFVEKSSSANPEPHSTIDHKYNIAVAGTSYVGLSTATLLAA